MIAQTRCPACEDGRQLALEPIDLDAQHRHYAPADLGLQARLTREAARSSTAYQMLACENCRLEFASPMASPSAEWYALAYEALDLYPQRRWEFGACLRRLRPHAAVFEFGCGTGAFLKLCSEQGRAARGVDFATSAVAACIRQGFNVIQMDIGDDVPAGLRRSASELVAFHVVEHLEEPRLLFRQARQIARPDARLWLAVPSDRRSSRHFRKADILDQPPHHMSRWSEAAFRESGAREGWKLMRVHYEPIPLAACLWSIATSSFPYEWAARRGWRAPSRAEKLLRGLLYPYALARRITVDRRLTGFSMLAQFALEPSPA